MTRQRSWLIRGTPPATIDSLPNELFLRVLSHLPNVSGLCRASAVCSLWRATVLTNEEVLWRPLVQARWRTQQALAALGVGWKRQYMLLSQTVALQYPAGSNDCAQHRRRAVATISASWVVSCPSYLAADACFYDCNDAPACLHSIAPVLSEVVFSGSWYRVPLPSGWTAFSLLFTSGMEECTSSTPRSMCTLARPVG